MKKLVGLFVFAVLTGISYSANSQVVKKTTTEVKKDARVVGHKTAEVASKGKSRATDKVYRDKVGPNGQTIYIDAHARYYWVDKRGHRNYVTEADLVEKVNP
jgi:hypothetical protein